MKEKSSIDPCEITIFPMTKFEAYMLTTSGVSFHELLDNEEGPEPPLPENHCEALLRFVEK